MTRGGTRATLAGARLDGRNTTTLTNQTAGVEQQFVGVRDVLDIKEFYFRIRLRVEVLVHILQHVLDTNLFAVADAPHTIELETLDDGTLEDEDRCGTRAGDKVDTLRIQVWDGEREDTMVVAVQKSDAVRTNQRRTVFLTRVEDALLQDSPRLRLLTESGRDDDKGFGALLLAEVVHIVGTELRRHHQHGEIRLGDILHIVESLDSLYFVFLGVYDVQVTTETTTDNITYDRATRLMYVVRAANDDDARGF